jgi:hypothetical protein
MNSSKRAKVELIGCVLALIGVVKREGLAAAILALLLALCGIAAQFL